MDVLDHTDEEAVKCVRGLVAVKRWTGVEVYHRSNLKVPTIIAAYNLFINSVDQMDQIRAVMPTRRREKRLSLSISTWFIDLSHSNAFALREELRRHDSNLEKTTSQDFRLSVAHALLFTESPMNTSNGSEDNTNSEHIMVECDRVRCALCLSRGLQKFV